MKTFQDYGITIPNRGGAEKTLPCPQCSSSRKNKKAACLSVNVDKGVWICHHCEWKGGLAKGVENRSNPYAYVAKQYTKPQYTTPQTQEQAVLSWFQSRGISQQVVSRNKIGYGTVYMPQLEKETTAIQFPYTRIGEVVNVKYRDGSKNFRLETGAELILYGFDDIEEGNTLYIVEGEMDKLSLEQVGYKNCVSVPNGAGGKTFEYLESAEEMLSKVTDIVIAVDNDDAGKALEAELSRRIGTDRCSRVTWPQGCKDANDTLLKHGPIGVVQALADAKEYPINRIMDWEFLSQEVDNYYLYGSTGGLHAGWEGLKDLYKVQPGELTVVTGIPTHGKSEWVDALMVNLADMHGWTFGIFSPENYPVAEHVGKLIEKISGSPFREGPTKRMTLEEMQEVKHWVRDHFEFFGIPDDETLNVEAVLETAKALVFKRGIKGLLIDPWNELDHSRPRELSETEYISISLGKVRRWARQNGVHVWIVAHPKIPAVNKDNADKMPAVPGPYDISGSAHWYNKCDNAITVYRIPKSNQVAIHIKKIKFKKNGAQGIAILRYNIVNGRYYEEVSDLVQRN